MTSQNSTNNKTGISFWNLLREDVSHKLWMLALSVLGSFTAGPLAFLFAFTNGYSFHESRYYKIIGENVYRKSDGSFLMTLAEYYLELLNGWKTYLNGVYMLLMCIIAFVGAIIVACYGFQFLYKKRTVDLYHSAPISRKKLFAVMWTNGFLIWLVPAFVCNLITFLLSCIFMKGMFIGTVFAGIMIGMLRQCLVFLIVYNVFLVAVMLSGNLINAALNGFTLGLLVFAVVAMFLLLFNYFTRTFYLPSDMYIFHPLYMLSPLTTPVLLMVQWFSDAYSFDVWGIHLIGGIVIMIANLFLALFLYLKRPSELAERGLECKPVRMVFRGAISLMSGVLFAAAFMEVTNRYNFAWMIFGAFFGSALAFAVLNVIYHVNFKEILSHKLQYVIVLAGCLVIFFGAMFDVTGYDKRLPREENITGLQLYISGLVDQSYYLNNGGYDNDEPSDAFLFKSQEDIHRLLDACVNNPKTVGNYLHVYVKVHTRLGSYYRRYRLSFQDLEVLEPFWESKEYVETYYPLQSLKLGLPNLITLNGYMGQTRDIDDKGRLEELMQAIHQDFEEHHTITELLKTSQRFALRIMYNEDAETHYNNRNTFEYSIPYSYKNTIALIEKWYPEINFDPTPEDVSILDCDFDFNLPKGMSAHDALYEYFGYDPKGNPLTVPAEKHDNDELTGYITCSFSTDDVEFLKEIAPYLIWGTYNNRLDYEYARLGRALITLGSYGDEGAANCYIHYGKLPLAILKKIEENMQTYYYDNEESYPVYYD